MPAELDYETMVGLWLNRQESMRRRAATVALGVSALLSKENAAMLAESMG